jgi:NADH:ubiquinone oxidoreductase subunit 4 (subunit M)
MIAWTIYITFGGAVLLLVLPRAFARWIALLATIAGLALGTVVFVGTPIPDLAHLQQSCACRGSALGMITTSRSMA